MTLRPPQGVEVVVTRPIQDVPYVPHGEAHAMLRSALAAPEGAPPLRELAAGKRRVAVLVGDITWPARYDAILPELVRVLAEFEIRPTRISFLCCPGVSGAVLGRRMIRRYGQDIAGHHEVLGWDGPEDRYFAQADLRLAVLPALPGVLDAIPEAVEPDLTIGIQHGEGSVPNAVAVRAGRLGSLFGEAEPAPQKDGCADVWLTTGSGSPSDDTLEEALAGLKGEAPEAQTLVLALGGREGMGSSPFVEALLEGLRALDAGAPAATSPSWTPAGALLAWVAQERRVVFFSQGLEESGEDVYLTDALAQLPRLAERVQVVSDEAVLWERLAGWHGSRYALRASPLGWRAREIRGR